MLKKITALVLVFVLAFSSLVLAKDLGQQQTEAAQRLVAMSILTGYEDGSLKLENNITRAEFAVLAVRILSKDKDVEKYKTDTKFSDVKKDNWASGYVNIAVKEGLITGYDDGTFKPQKNISYAEILAVLVRLLGYDDTLDPNEKWPVNYLKKSTELGINKDMVIAAGSYATRGDVVLFIDRSLVIKLDREY